jgi:hypothetical protein
MASNIQPRKESPIAIAEARHYLRFIRSERGDSLEDIAKEDGISVAMVEKSIRKVQIQKAIFTSENTQDTIRRMLVENSGKASKALGTALTAKKYVRKQDKEGKTKYVPVDDIEVQMEGLKAFKGIAEVVQPKAGGSVVNVKQVNQTAAVTNIRGNGYEERMDEIRRKAADFNKLPPTIIASVTEESEDNDEEYEGDDE